MKADNLELIGQWISDPSDLPSPRKYGCVSLDFRSDGRLIYTIYEDGKQEVMLLGLPGTRRVPHY